MKNLFINLLLSLIVVSASFSCNNQPVRYKAPEFKDGGQIIGDTLIPDVLCTRILSMEIIDSTLLIYCINSMDKKAFQLYDKQTGKLLKTFGTYGNGPGELPNSFDHTLDKKNKTLYVAGGKKIISFRVDSVLRNENYTFENQQELSTVFNNSAFFFYKDSLFLAMNDARTDRDYYLAILKANGDTISCYRKFPDIKGINPEDKMSIRQFYAFRSIGVRKPDGSKFAIATTCGLNLELFDLVDNRIQKNSFLRFVEPNWNVKSIQNEGIIPGLIWSLCASNQFIYGLWSEDTDKAFPEKLVTFRWDGTPDSQYQFGPGATWGWTVDTVDEDQMLYLTIKDPEGRLNIVKYNLK